MLLKQKGFSLPEVMIALGLVAGISIVLMKIIENQKSNEAYLKTIAEINKTVSTLQGSLNNLDSCKDIMAGRSRSRHVNPSAPSGVITDLSKTVKHLGVNVGTVRLLRTPLQTDPASSIADYGAFYFRYGDIVLTNTSAGLNTVAELFLRFRYKKLSLFSWGQKNNVNDPFVEKRLRFIVTLNDGGADPNLTDVPVSSCGPIVSSVNSTAKEKFCRSLGSLADWVGDRCILRGVTCPWGQVPAGFTSLNDAGKNCVYLHDRLDLTRVFNNGSIDPTCIGPLVNPRYTVSQTSEGRFYIRCQ